MSIDLKDEKNLIQAEANQNLVTDIPVVKTTKDDFEKRKYITHELNIEDFYDKITREEANSDLLLTIPGGKSNKRNSIGSPKEILSNSEKNFASQKKSFRKKNFGVRINGKRRAPGIASPTKLTRDQEVCKLKSRKRKLETDITDANLEGYHAYGNRKKLKKLNPHMVELNELKQVALLSIIGFSISTFITLMIFNGFNDL
ncbi:hypothetical protein PACTADRAFT_4457 [Pachysolen tannophilus NRRL Y-2460]|uniref:Uncharacterized protein n=1 Tax=Pachysolen tannophilus NRRL Y-2460 TaxID=669874 RepID=A0A1E4TS00_PACTA|nr:hypothetical protein PACTADRAFT_4457 [Pachysolen tannophilus NRRL Y-2460]